MLVRDRFNILGQHNTLYMEAGLDFGDSAARTGIMALCGSKVDQDLLLEFVTDDYKLVRHPYDPKWNDSKLTSRDQLIQWAAGEWQAKNYYNSLICIQNYSQKWFINKDFLPPDVKLYLYQVGCLKIPLWLKILGYPNMFLSLLWTCFVMPENETNQMICMCSIYGDWWLKKLVKWHPHLQVSIYTYWGTFPFRDQWEISDMLWKYVQGRIK